MEPEDFEYFEGMSKEEFQEWMYNNRHMFGEFMYDADDIHNHDTSEYSDGKYTIKPFGAKEQLYAVDLGAWRYFVN